MSLRTADYDFILPEELIAPHPAERRDASRLLVLHRDDGRIEHRHFRDLPDYLRPGDLAVLNDTRVLPARLRLERGKGELLLIEQLAPNRWSAWVKPGRRFRPGAAHPLAGTMARVTELLPDGSRVLEFDAEPDLERHGEMPLPPYIARDAEAADRERYQTVYAARSGAVAAPTAGLHFTPELLAAIPHAFVTLHVGPGTFKPVTGDDLAGHTMHSEWFQLGEETAARINAAERVIAVGTTSVRTIESCADESGQVTPHGGRTEIFIHPPYRFRRVGALVTNFHLPRSTLLMLASAFAGREQILRAYAEAIRESYRFYSYGDAMLIL